jgi:hypothetical protein
MQWPTKFKFPSERPPDSMFSMFCCEICIDLPGFHMFPRSGPSKLVEYATAVVNATARQWLHPAPPIAYREGRARCMETYIKIYQDTYRLKKIKE